MHHCTVRLASMLVFVSVACVPEARAQQSARRTQHTPSIIARTMEALAPSAPVASNDPPTPTSARTMRELESIASNMRVVSYRHDTRVNVREGRYEFDCSGLIAWVLARSAPAAHRLTVEQASGARPLAADYTRSFLRVSPTQQRGPWARIARVEDARAGDILAWIRPRIVRSNNTGHVVFVTGAPRRSTRYENAWLVPIADSSRYRHQDDDREGTTRTGFGRGTILIAEDPTTGAPRAFGWFGDLSPYVFDTQIAIARPLR